MNHPQLRNECKSTSLVREEHGCQAGRQTETQQKSMEPGYENESPQLWGSVGRTSWESSWGRAVKSPSKAAVPASLTRELQNISLFSNLNVLP